uniref:Uncharacterized protein n=1 Tax=Anguilla anguilla TaxID=7936 RepID=A0A0E9R6B4_ANGAN
MLLKRGHVEPCVSQETASTKTGRGKPSSPSSQPQANFNIADTVNKCYICCHFKQLSSSPMGELEQKLFGVTDPS